MSQAFKSKRIFKIKFESFWDGFDSENTFLHRLFQMEGLSLSVTPSHELDSIVFSSHFEPKIKPLHQLKIDLKHFLAQIFKAKVSRTSNPTLLDISSLRIFYTGENYRVPLTEQFSLSHDLDDYNSRNIYYPYLFDHLLMAKLKQHDHLFGSSISYDYLFNKRKLDEYPRKFACIFFGNDVPIRRRLVDEMSKFGEVDVFGKAGNNYVRDRSKLIGQYKYVLCPENDYFPGYVTEKIIHAYCMGSVPIYWGGLTKHQGINANSAIVVDPSESLKLQFEKIANLQQSLYKEIYEQPLMIQEPDWSYVVNKIVYWIESWKPDSTNDY
jgi:hypothetical protein